MTELTAARTTPLGRLIKERRESLGLSLREASAASGLRRGTGTNRVSSSRIQAIEAGDVTYNMSEEVKNGLRQALDIPARTLNEAIAASVGLEQLHTDRGELVALVDRAEQLDPGAREAFLKAANALLDGLRRRD